ncbi:MAG: hypothetical protein MR750_03035 [Methanobrevibacter boviskoreani]|uniref:hypothetical protein n=1 Tax=Methanobrevibacter boviskoreani TaxID=1348249 RepID=UPI0023A823D8|nr:hypothetical protein [Methanobrevibacter boviskoreani]MCI6930215.1 hypothetical protein [Methanobrevibacter boviskoreani]
MEFEYGDIPNILYQHKYLLLYECDFNELYDILSECGTVIKITYPSSSKHIMKIILHRFGLDKKYKDITTKSLDFLVDLLKEFFSIYYNDSSYGQKLSYHENNISLDNVSSYPYAVFNQDTVILLFDNFSRIKENTFILFDTFFDFSNIYIVANTYDDEFSIKAKRSILYNFLQVNEEENKMIIVKQPYLVFIAILFGILYLAIAFVIEFKYAFIILGSIWITTSWYKFENFLLNKM